MCCLIRSSTPIYPCLHRLHAACSFVCLHRSCIHLPQLSPSVTRFRRSYSIFNVHQFALGEPRGCRRPPYRARPCSLAICREDTQCIEDELADSMTPIFGRWARFQTRHASIDSSVLISCKDLPYLDCLLVGPSAHRIRNAQLTVASPVYRRRRSSISPTSSTA